MKQLRNLVLELTINLVNLMNICLSQEDCLAMITANHHILGKIIVEIILQGLS